MRSFLLPAVVVCAAVLASAVVVRGQAPAASAPLKAAVMNFQRSVLDTDEIKKAFNELQVKYKPRQDAIQRAQQELNDIQTQLQASQGKLSSAGEADLQARGQRKQTQVDRLTQDLQADFEADRDEAVRKASTRMGELLKKLAEEKGLDLIIDTGAAPYARTGIEITDQAIAAYNKAYPAK